VDRDDAGERAAPGRAAQGARAQLGESYVGTLVVAGAAWFSA